MKQKMFLYIYLACAAFMAVLSARIAYKIKKDKER